MPAAPTVTFLSDYGLVDDFVGVCHGVIARICPQTRIIDLTHGVPRHAVLAGALVLERSLAFMPAGVHLAVVDPEVGARRRAVALRCAQEDRLLVGPDNGLLLGAAAAFGGVVEAVEISSSPWRLEPVSATFHGRDLFAPVAARLAAGEPLAAAGAPLEPEELVALPRTAATPDGPGALLVHAVYADGFGNLELDARHADLATAGIAIGDRVTVSHDAGSVDLVVARTFADVAEGELLLYESPSAAVAIALNGGSAAAALGLRPGAQLRLAAGP